MKVVLTAHAHERAYERFDGVDAPDLQRTVVREVRAALRDGRVGRRLPSEFVRPFAAPGIGKRGVRCAWDATLARAYVIADDRTCSGEPAVVVLTVLVTQANFFDALVAVA